MLPWSCAAAAAGGVTCPAPPLLGVVSHAGGGQPGLCGGGQCRRCWQRELPLPVVARASGVVSHDGDASRC
eukprot:359712-Chlamydomonas_euryale.AAC.2